jgi:hypothetical protein
MSIFFANFIKMLAVPGHTAAIFLPYSGDLQATYLLYRKGGAGLYRRCDLRAYPADFRREGHCFVDELRSFENRPCAAP